MHDGRFSSQLCIVPATQVSGGGVDTAGVLFHRLYLPSVKMNKLISFRNYRNSLDPEANKSTVSPASARFFSIRRGKLCCSIFLLVQLPSTTPPTYQLGEAYSVPWNSNLFAASSGFENGSGEGVSDYQRLQAFAFGGTLGGPSTSKNWFLFSRFVSDASRHHRQSSSEDIRS